MKVLVAGSRSIKKFDIEKLIPPNAELIITGGAEGIDKLAEEYADKRLLSKLVLRPQYSLYGRSAPIKRNELMVSISDICIIIWDGHSRGTQQTLAFARACGKEILLIKASQAHGEIQPER